MKRSNSINEFILRAKSSLPREHNGKELLEQWEDRCVDYRRAGLDLEPATIYASLEFLCLTRILNEYDFDEIIRNRPIGKPAQKTRSRAHAKNAKSDTKDRKDGPVQFVPGADGVVTCDDLEQSHRENLRWAINSAGEFRRTKQPPVSCPNDAAWWLYEQAVSEPKDFLTKYNQIEGKSDDEAEAMRKARYTGEQSIAEIDQMLTALEKEENEDAS